jgi:predicted N-acetyltransferase YhbS
MFPDYAKAVDTISKIQELDAADNIFVVLPHDGSVVGHIPLFPRPINDWQDMGLAVSTRWLLCKDIMGA